MIDDYSPAPENSRWLSATQLGIDCLFAKKTRGGGELDVWILPIQTNDQCLFGAVNFRKLAQIRAGVPAGSCMRTTRVYFTRRKSR